MPAPTSTIDFSHLYHKRITIKGMPGYTPSDMPNCFAAAAEGKISAQIEQVLPLSRAAEAHRLVESRRGARQDRARSDAGVIAVARVVDRLRGAHRRSRGKCCMPARDARMMLAPVLVGKAEVEVGKRAADGDVADVEGCSFERRGFVVE